MELFKIYQCYKLKNPLKTPTNELYVDLHNVQHLMVPVLFKHAEVLLL